MKVNIRRFTENDIPNKIAWVNDPLNNRFLHYDLPLETGKTRAWFLKNKDKETRYDAVILVDGIPVGMVGLLDIDSRNRKAEFYIMLGLQQYKGKGISTQAGIRLLGYAFGTLRLNRVYLYTETGNTAAQKLFEKLGFIREGLASDDLFYNGKYVDRYLYGISSGLFFKRHVSMLRYTPVMYLDTMEGNRIYIKRDDLYPFSFGGNKARKAASYFEEIDAGDYNCVVTYGSGSSNHCRVVANMAAARGLGCYIISPDEGTHGSYNSLMAARFGAVTELCPVQKVHETIERRLETLRTDGHRPYFIAGGGHGNLGTQAYVNCYREIQEYEEDAHIHFGYVFHASGTGTTQAGLVCGQLMAGDERKIIGISIARKNPRGRDIILESIREYLNERIPGIPECEIQRRTVFDDGYAGNGYGASCKETGALIDMVMARYGIPLDSTYTGKAFGGMLGYIRQNGLQDKDILFIHTGGTPLFFDFLTGQEKERRKDK